MVCRSSLTALERLVDLEGEAAAVAHVVRADGAVWIHAHAGIWVVRRRLQNQAASSAKMLAHMSGWHACLACGVKGKVQLTMPSSSRVAERMPQS